MHVRKKKAGLFSEKKDHCVHETQRLLKLGKLCTNFPVQVCQCPLFLTRTTIAISVSD